MLKLNQLFLLICWIGLTTSSAVGAADVDPINFAADVVTKKLAADLDLKNLAVDVDPNDLVTYTAAVLEYEPYSENGNGSGVLLTNAQVFAMYAADAKSQGADIMITPEYGLQSLDMAISFQKGMKDYSQFVPNPSDRSAPHAFDTANMDNVEALIILSQAAKDNNMYMVVDMAEVEACSADTIAIAPFGPAAPLDECPLNGYFFYNTQVVFDRTGVVIARYRKQNLFNEDYFTQGPLDDRHALFETDFDVAFSLTICFDIVFEHPGLYNVEYYGLKDIAMSTAWVDELPYFLANEVHNGAAHGVGINIMVSGYHAPLRSKLGSGIYNWYDMPRNNALTYTYDKDSGDVLLVGKVTTINKSILFTGPKKEAWKEWRQWKENPEKVSNKLRESIKGSSSEIAKTDVEENVKVPTIHLILHTNLTSFNSSVLVPAQNSNEQVCFENSFCCTLSYTYDNSGGDTSETYMLLVHSGVVYVGGGRYPIGSQICSVVWCSDKNDVTTCGEPRNEGDPDPLGTFGPFSLSAIFDSNRMIVAPQGIFVNYSLIDDGHLDFGYDSTTMLHTLSGEDALENTMALSLLGRWFAADILG